MSATRRRTPTDHLLVVQNIDEIIDKRQLHLGLCRHLEDKYKKTIAAIIYPVHNPEILKIAQITTRGAIVTLTKPRVVDILIQALSAKPQKWEARKMSQQVLPMIAVKLDANVLSVLDRDFDGCLGNILSICGLQRDPTHSNCVLTGSWYQLAEANYRILKLLEGKEPDCVSQRNDGQIVLVTIQNIPKSINKSALRQKLEAILAKNASHINSIIYPVSSPEIIREGHVTSNAALVALKQYKVAGLLCSGLRSDSCGWKAEQRPLLVFPAAEAHMPPSLYKCLQARRIGSIDHIVSVSGIRLTQTEEQTLFSGNWYQLSEAHNRLLSVQPTGSQAKASATLSRVKAKDDVMTLSPTKSQTLPRNRDIDRDYFLKSLSLESEQNEKLLDQTEADPPMLSKSLSLDTDGHHRLKPKYMEVKFSNGTGLHKDTTKPLSTSLDNQQQTAAGDIRDQTRKDYGTRQNPDIFAQSGIRSMFRRNKSGHMRVKFSEDCHNPYRPQRSSSGTELPVLHLRTQSGIEVRVSHDDVTKQNVDVIVNAADTTLEMVAGCAKSVSDAAGIQLKSECMSSVRCNGEVPVGTVRATDSGNLNCCKLIHAVGPHWSNYKDKAECQKQLGDTYMNCLMDSRQNRSIAMPAVSAGTAGVPKDIVSRTMRETIIKFSNYALNNPCNLHDIRIVDVNRAVVEEIQKQFLEEVNNGILENVEAPNVSTMLGSCRAPNQRPKVRSLQAPKLRESSSASNKKQTTSEANKVTDHLVACPICEGTIQKAKTLILCKHTFCESCIDNHFEEQKVCPICKKCYHNFVTGNQPEGGKMRYCTTKESLPGFEDCQTIKITYSFQAGLQTSEHPNPGKQYFGVTRLAYLPDNEHGRELLGLLEKAFEARLIFSVGTSRSTGIDDVIVWSGQIIHKTKNKGGAKYFGYPDPNYLTELEAALASKVPHFISSTRRGLY